MKYIKLVKKLKLFNIIYIYYFRCRHLQKLKIIIKNNI